MQKILRMPSRRRLIVAGGQWLAALGISAMLPPLVYAGGNSNNEVRSLLGGLAHRLLPLEPEGAPLYGPIARQLLLELQSPQGAQMQADLERMLEVVKPSWQTHSQDQRRHLLERFYDSALIQRLRWLTHEHLLRDPSIWQRLGYQGSAIEQGGYLQRGFDDIDWLPQTTQQVAP